VTRHFNETILLAEVHEAVAPSEHRAGPAADAIVRRIVIPSGVVVPGAIPVVGPQGVPGQTVRVNIVSFILTWVNMEPHIRLGLATDSDRPPWSDQPGENNAAHAKVAVTIVAFLKVIFMSILHSLLATLSNPLLSLRAQYCARSRIAIIRRLPAGLKLLVRSCYVDRQRRPVRRTGGFESHAFVVRSLRRTAQTGIR
jgi:hypothetical protein